MFIHETARDIATHQASNPKGMQICPHRLYLETQIQDELIKYAKPPPQSSEPQAWGSVCVISTQWHWSLPCEGSSRRKSRQQAVAAIWVRKVIAGNRGERRVIARKMGEGRVWDVLLKVESIGFPVEWMGE